VNRAELFFGNGSSPVKIRLKKFSHRLTQMQADCQQKAVRLPDCVKPVAVLFFQSAARAESIVNGSAATFPAALFVRAINDDDGHSRIAAGITEHFLTSCAIVLRILFREGNALRVVPVSGFGAIGTSGFGIHDNFSHKVPVNVYRSRIGVYFRFSSPV
jgi:hypothetical protein